jgi:hypothetical protein
MRYAKLTRLRAGDRQDGMKSVPSKRSCKRVGAGMAMVSTALLAGCINVNAPQEPIVIELNINIRQEVIYRLAEDAANTIENNADIF